MFYSLLFLTALLSQLQGGSATSTATRAMGTSTRGKMAALNNLVVIGNGVGDGTTGTSGDGDISFSYYSYAVNLLNGDVGQGNYADAEAVTNGYDNAATNTAAATVTEAVSTDLAGNTFKGLGHDVAIADMNTVFVSQSSSSLQTGRVVVYEGNVTDFSQTQILKPYDGKHNMESEAFFGESISAAHGVLAVGCQNCNSSAPVFSGTVFVYKPTKSGRWSESQVLTADGVMFLGERVAVHNKVLVAAGDDANGAIASAHNFDNTANTVVVYEEGPGPKGKFEQRQVITPWNGFRESITGVTVFDETIAITTMGSDQPNNAAAARDKVYIYYPVNERYGLAPKPKPGPQQWTCTQILTSATVGDIRYTGEPDTSISMNTLKYLTTDGTNVAVATSIRQCLSCKFSAPDVVAQSPANTDWTVLMASDETGFYFYRTTVTTDLLADPVQNSISDGCLTISLQDQFNDGWGIASLLITGPDGHEDRFTVQCESANPNEFKYCPRSQADGKYNLHIENAMETPFGWEIMWRVAVGSTWYYGDRHTHMDFLWDAKYGDFHVGATKGLLPLYDTCEICDPNPPTAKPKRRSLSNLRSLHHKGASTGSTSSPTISEAPTIVQNGVSGDLWNHFNFDANTWFSADYNGAYFWVSDREGKHLFKTGTSCNSAGDKCYVDIPDGDYTLRVGSSILDTTAVVPTYNYQFCGSTNSIGMNTQLHFTALGHQCYAGALYEVETLCTNTYKSDYYLNVDLLLGGATETLSVTDESTLKAALSETVLSVLGTMPSSLTVGKQGVTSNGVKVSVLLEFASLPDASSVDNFLAETSSASSLLKYELIGSQALSANFLHGEVSGVTIMSVSTKTGVHDYSKVDESSYQTVKDFIWKTSATEESSSGYNDYARYVAEGAYAVVGVAAVFAVTLFVKRAMSKAPEETKA